MKPRIRKATPDRLLASQQFQAPLPTAPADKTPENGAAGTTGPVQALLDNPIIQSLLSELLDSAEIEVKR